jgi:hypothetical protein
MLLCLGLYLASCKGKANINNEETGHDLDSPGNESEAQLPEDFSEFYEQFHTDEEYQVAHIIWPLRGLPDNADSVIVAEDNYYYQKEDWIMHHKLNDPENNFEQYFAIIDDKLIIDKIEMKSTNLSMERRFAKMNDDWNLIYYVGMNPMKR